MARQTYDEQAITRYLLGSLPDGGTISFDELSFTDEEFVEALRVVENDLVDAYVRGELSGQTLEEFESFYIGSTLRRKKIKFAEAFQVFAEKAAAQQAVAGEGVPSEPRKTHAGPLSALDVFTFPRLGLQWGMATAALVLLLASGWLAFQNYHLREQMNQEQAKRAELQQREEELQTQIAAERSATPIATQSISSTPASEGAREPVIVQLNDGKSRVRLDPEGKLSGADNLPSAYRGMVKEALTNQRLEKSLLLAGLNRPASSLMGGDDQGNRFLVTAPVGEVMMSDRPTFRWSQLTGATGYVVEVYDEKFDLVATSPQLTRTSWTALQPLKHGGIYSWQVKAIKDGQEFNSPRPPAPQAKFRILDQAKAVELTEARRAHASSHLTLGLLYAQAGLLDEAEHEFRLLQKANPNSAIVRRLLASVRAMRH